MKEAILIGLVVALATILAACGTDVEEGAQETDVPVGENPTSVASSWEATPVPTTEPEPAPTPLNLPIGEFYTPTPEEIQIWEVLTADEREVGDKTLSETDQYKITYLISNRQVSVTVKAPSFEESKIASEGWFHAQGLSPQSLCVISRINFVPSQEVMDAGYEFKAEDSVPTGCDTPSP